MHMCPVCGGTTVRSSSRFSFNDLMVRLFTFKRAYRCFECWHRFYDNRSGTRVRRQTGEFCRNENVPLLR